MTSGGRRVKVSVGGVGMKGDGLEEDGCGWGWFFGEGGV